MQMNQRRRCDRQLIVCSLCWLGPAISEELAEEAASDNVCVR